MRVCIYGAGASGGHFAVRLAGAGHRVSVIARGAHLAAIREHGLTLLEGDRRHVARVDAGDDPAEFGQQDLVIVAVKATGLGAVAAGLAPLVGRGTRVVFAQNGMPWWYPHGLAPARPSPPDLPIFRLAPPFLALLRLDQVLGGLIYSANEAAAPGVIRNTSPGRNRLDVAPVATGDAGAASRLRACLTEAGIASQPVADIRDAVWRKLLVNMSGSTIALATGNKSSVSRADDMLGETYLRIVREGLAIAAAHGHDLRGSIDPEAMRAQLNDHKPSLLQDYERSRPMEVAEIILAPVTFARAAGVPAPSLEALAAIVRRLAIDRGLYHPE